MAFLGNDGEPLVYPVFVRNTFVDVPLRQPSLEAFLVERKVHSCPASSVERLGGDSFLEAMLGPPLHTQESGSDCSTADTEKRPKLPDTLSQRPSGGFPGPPSWLRRSHTWGIGLASCLQVELEEPEEIVNPDLRAQLSPWPDTDDEGHRVAHSVVMQSLDSPVAKDEEPLPSRGSAGHKHFQCKPCAFYHDKGCQNGFECTFCHLCEAGEKRRRRKERSQVKGSLRRRGEGGQSGKWWPSPWKDES